MPSPIGHALGGAIVALLLGARGATGAQGATGAVRCTGASGAAPVAAEAPDAPGHRTAPRAPRAPHAPVALCVIAACLPDLDFLWGRHNMETHSLGFAVLVGLAVLAWRRSTRLAAAAALAVASHVLFDWLGSDTTPPLGVMALWPLSSEYYFASANIFQAISRRYWLPNFVSHNALAVLRELVLLAPVAAALLWRARRQ